MDKTGVIADENGNPLIIEWSNIGKEILVNFLSFNTGSRNVYVM
jgi:hypothetical protein